MKKIILYSLLFALLTFSYSCGHFGKKGTVDPDDTMRGRKVMEWNSDKTPKVVYYYKIDANGNMTNEKPAKYTISQVKRNMSRETLKIILEMDSGVLISLTAK